MSNGYKLELSEDGTGDVYLSFWDSEYGNDRVWEINEQGDVREIFEDGRGKVDINLPNALRDLLHKLQER